MNRPELETLLDQYGVTRELLDDGNNDWWDSNVIPTEVLVEMITWRYVEQGKCEFRVAEDGELEFRYIGDE